MKHYKKLVLGLGLALLTSIFLLLPAKSFAADQPFNGSSEWRNAVYTMNDKSKIIVTFPSHSSETFNNDGSNKKYNAATTNALCSGTITFNSGQTINNKPNIAAAVSAKFVNGETVGQTCNGLSTSVSGSISIVNNTTSGGGAGATGPKTIAFSGQTYTQLSTASGQNRFYGKSVSSTPPGDDCYGRQVIVLASVPSSSNSPVKATLLPTVFQSTGGTQLSTQISYFPSNIPVTIASLGSCYYDSSVDNGNHVLLSVTAAGDATVSGCSQGGTACQQSLGNGSGSTGDPAGQTQSCSNSSFTSLEWVICPFLGMADTMTAKFNDILKDLLNFDTHTYLNNQVKNTWNIMRVISSALLIIIMLIAIISQAVGGGPIDAYTLRKILPRLVVAVILIQVSWWLLLYVIDLANSLGHAVRDIMSAPFGGWQNLDLEHLIGSVSGGFTTSLTVGALFTGLVITGIVAGFTIGGVGLLAAGAILTFLLAFVLLVLRQVFIVLAVIFFPIALLAWILPGTQRYWKLWSDNFIKLLMLFPIMMALIYGGRIFAHIFATTTTGTSGKIIPVFVVFVGFFAPYWFIPKAFRWGGQLYGSMANGVLNATQGVRGAPRKFATSQAQANRQQRATDRNERLSYGRGRFGDRLLAAAGGFALGRSAYRARSARGRAEGREAGEKEVAQEIVGSRYENQDHQQKLVTLDYLAQGQTDPETGLNGSNPAMQRWALDQLATFGDWDRIDMLRAGGNLDERVWQTFMAKNISAVHQNAPYLSPLRRDMSQLGYQEAATWKDHAVHEFERQIMSGQIRTADGQGYEDAPDQERQLALGVDFATRALTDERVRANLSADAVAAFERIRDLGSPQVSIARQGGRAVEAHLPSALMIQNTPAARQNLTASLMSQDAATRQVTVAALGQRLADPNLDAHSRDVMENYMAELRTQAASSGSQEAVSAYNDSLAEWIRLINDRPNQAQREAIGQGLQGTDVIDARNNAQTAANTAVTRIQGLGLTPL